MGKIKKGDKVLLRQAKELGEFPVLGVLSIPKSECSCGNISIYEDKNHRDDCPRIPRHLVVKDDQDVFLNMGKRGLVSLPGSSLQKINP